MDPKDNPQGEPVSASTPEPSAAPQAPGSVVEPAKVEAPAAANVDVAELQKQLEKLTMENNLHKNEKLKREAEKETARLAELSEVEQLKEKLSQAEIREQQREAKEFRNSVLEDYLKDSPSALKAAKALIAKNPLNLVWGEGLTEDEAKADLIGQLDALKEVVGEQVNDTPKPPAQRSNNPAYREVDPDRAALIVEARKTGDFSKIIGMIPSVERVVKSFQ